MVSGKKTSCEELPTATMPQFGNFSPSSLQVINPRLTEENYQYWRAQTPFMVAAFGLEDHLKGLLLCPAPFISVRNDSDSTNIKKVNPEYAVWKRFDKLHMSWLLASISECIYSHIAKGSTSTEI